MRQHEAQNSAIVCACAPLRPAKPRQSPGILTAKRGLPGGWQRLPSADDSKHPAWHRKNPSAGCPERGSSSPICTISNTTTTRTRVLRAEVSAESHAVARWLPYKSRAHIQFSQSLFGSTHTNRPVTFWEYTYKSPSHFLGVQPRARGQLYSQKLRMYVRNDSVLPKILPKK